MRWFWIISLWLAALAAPALAQDNDRTLLQRLLEDNLSAAGREVRIEGFTGALSSKASLDKLTIADDQGIWLTLTGVTLDWSRKALLSGRLEVTALTAATIDMPRLPVTPDSDEDTATSSDGFSLPELPVAVQIDAVQIGQVSLGAPVLGQAVRLSLQGNAQLENGSGQARLQVLRLDREGQIALSGSYTNSDRMVALDLSVIEEAGGLLASLAKLPGTPAVAFSAKGAGPIDDFRAQIALTSDGQERLGGVVGTKLLADTGARQIAASLSGDMTPLFAPDLQPFFGPNVELALLARKQVGGQVQVDQFALTSAQMSLAGSLELAATGLPERFDLSGQISGEGPVVLPLAGPPTQLDRATVTARYDRDADQGWVLRSDMLGLTREGMVLDRLVLNGDGMISHDPQTVSASLSLQADGVDPGNDDLARAVGQALTGTVQINWQDGAPITLRDLVLTSGDTRLRMNAQVTPDTSPSITGDASLSAPDVSRFAALAKRPLQGALALDISRFARAKNGDLSLSLTAKGTNLRSGQAQLDKILAGASDVELQGALQAGAPRLDRLRLKTSLLDLRADGSDSGVLDVDATLAQIAAFVPELPGALRVAGTVTPGDENWGVELTVQGPEGLTATTAGALAPAAGTADLTLRGQAPLALANGFIAPRTMAGSGRFDLSLAGPLDLSGLSGSISVSDARLSDPVSFVALRNLNARVDLSSGTANVDLNAQSEAGGSLQARGRVGLLTPNSSDLSVRLLGLTLSDGVLFTTQVDGDVTLQGPIQSGAVIAGTLQLGETELRVPSGPSGTGGPIPEITHRNEPTAVRDTRRKAGVLTTASRSAAVPLGLNLRINAPNRIFLRGNGLEAEMGGQLRLAGTTGNVVPSGRFDLVRGRLQILGQRLDMTEGFATLRGSFDPYIRLVAETRAQDIAARATLEGLASAPGLTFSSSPQLPEDEVLARLLFGRSAQSLSPLQAAQLAAAVSGLAGSGGSGFVGKLRESFGLDDLDVVKDETDGTSVRAGKYLSDNIYTDVTVGSGGTSEINLNLDLSPNVTVRGGASSTGDTNVGIFFERDY